MDLGHAKCAASVGATLAEDLLEQLRSAVCNEMLLNEARAAIDKNHELHNLTDASEVARGCV